MRELIYIPIQAVSVKNCKVCFRNRITYNKRAKTYKKELLKNLNELSPYIQKLIGNKYRQIIIGVHFVYPDKRKRDWINMMQGLCDGLVESNVIADDNEDYLITKPLKLDGKYYSYVKNKVGIIIEIINRTNNLFYLNNEINEKQNNICNNYVFSDGSSTVLLDYKLYRSWI